MKTPINLEAEIKILTREIEASKALGKIVAFIAESNRIEGITRPPTVDEYKEFVRFLALPKITVKQLQRFVTVYQPNAVLREKLGQDVYIGNSMPPRGGPAIRPALEKILRGAVKQQFVVSKDMPDNAYITH